MGDRIEVHERPEPERRGRVDHALRCPYCRDAVTARGTVSCARTGCGALYHGECWDECIARYGGCAIYGCGSKAASGLSRPGFFARTVKLLVAAALFSPRAARALAEASHVSTTDLDAQRDAIIEREIQARGLETGGAGEAPSRSRRTCYSLAISFTGVLLVSFPFLYVAFLIFISFRRPSRTSIGTDLLVLVGPFVGLFALVIVLVTVASWITAFGTVFRNEVAALARAEEGATVLGQIHEGRDRGKSKPGGERESSP